ncbi:MAG: glycosyltransferase family 39 protein [bacterium]
MNSVSPGYWTGGRVALCIVAVAVLLRVAAMAALGTAPHPVYFESARIAWNVLDGKGFVFNYAYLSDELLATSYMAPVYVYLLVPFLAFGSALGSALASSVSIQFMHALLAGVTCLLLIRLGTRAFDRRIGLLAGALYAVFPPAVVMGTRMHEINLTVPLIVWLVYEIMRTRTDGSWRQSLRLGGAMGLCLLAEPSYGIFCAVAMVFLFAGARFPPSERFRQLLLSVLVGGLVLTPWLARNWVVHQKFVFVKSVAGLNMWFGNNPQATGSDRLAPTSSGNGDCRYMTMAMEPELARKIREAHTEIEKDRILGSAAVEFIREHPGQALKLAFRKVVLLWWRDPLHPLGREVVYQMCELALFLAGLAGLVLGLRRREPFCILATCLMVCQTAVYMVFCVLPRYRMLQDPFLVVALAFLVIRIFDDRCIEAEQGGKNEYVS